MLCLNNRGNSWLKSCTCVLHNLTITLTPLFRDAESAIIRVCPVKRHKPILTILVYIVGHWLEHVPDLRFENLVLLFWTDTGVCVCGMCLCLVCMCRSYVCVCVVCVCVWCVCVGGICVCVVCVCVWCVCVGGIIMCVCVVCVLRMSYVGLFIDPHIA